MNNRLPFLRLVSKRFPVLTILAAAILALTCLSAIFSARFNTDITRLVPTHAEKTALYFSLLEKAGGMEKAYIVFSSDNIVDHINKIDAIGAELSSSRLIRAAEWKISEETKKFLKETYAVKAPLLLSEKEMGRFMEKLTPEGMALELEKTKQRLALPGSQEGLARLDPLNLFEVFSPHLRFSDVSFDMGSGYFLTPDNRSLIMILTPTGSPRDISFSKSLVSSIESILARYETAGLKAELTGSHAITLHEASAMKKEIILNTVTSLISVTFIFLLFFRSMKSLLYTMSPVVFAIISTTGIVLFMTGAISEVTGAFAGLIIGLGIDLGVVLYVRYLINTELFENPVQRMDRSIEQTYRGITTGVTTTALTFLPMTLSSFSGIRELGLLTGIGMLICWIFLFTVASLAIRPSSGRFIEIRQLREMALFSASRPLQVIAGALCLTVLLALFIPRVSFMGDITKLGTDDNRPRRALDELKDSFIREQGVFITETTMDLESALIRSVEIKDRLAENFVNISAAADILPPNVRQKKNIGALSKLDTGRVLKDFRTIAGEKGFDLTGFGLFTKGLARMLNNREQITPGEIGPVSGLLDRLLINEDDQWRIVVTGSIKKDAPASLLRGLTFTGPAFIREELFSILKKDTLLISIIGLVLVNIILYLDFRKVYHQLLCQIPVALSIVCTLGIMGITGISLNFMDAIVFILLFGIGTDYTVHLLHRYHADRDMAATFQQTGKAVLVAGLTTIAGFGSIGFSSYKGLATMGQVAAIGVTLCIAFSLTIVPAFLGLHGGKADEQ